MVGTTDREAWGPGRAEKKRKERMTERRQARTGNVREERTAQWKERKP